MGELSDSSTVFIQMVHHIFPPVISGILLSAILAASMSTADSQLLSASSAFASDFYKPVIRKGQSSDQEMFWAGRIVVLFIALLAVIIAANPNSGSIMGLVENAWGIFGAAFGPAILLSIFWRRFTMKGAIAGIVCGAAADLIWLYAIGLGIYEIIPGFLVGLLAAVVVTLLDRQPDKAVLDLFDKATDPSVEI
jgi:sodium/proline symporter